MENQTPAAGVPYRDPKATPLKYHCVFWFLILTVNILVDFRNFTGDLDFLSVPGFGVITAVDALHLGLCLACFIGFFEWKKYAFYSLMVFLVFELVLSLIPEFFEWSAYPAIMVENLLFVAACYLAWEIPTAVYYWKRRNLFFGESH